MLAALGCVPAQPTPVAHATLGLDALQDLWIDVSMGPPLVNWFNDIARPNDIARADHVSQLRLLDDISSARRLVVFKSAEAARDAMPALEGRVDIIGYNLETGPANPLEEQEDPVRYVEIMHELAEEHGMLLAVGPDRTFALNHGVKLAPYVDLFVLQVQRIQTDPEAVREFVLPLISELREVNPDIEISIQVRTEGDVVALVDLIESLEQELDGVSILTSPQTIDVAAALVTELRSRSEPPPEETATPRPSPTAHLVQVDPDRPESSLLAPPTDTPTAAPTSEAALPSAPASPTSRPAQTSTAAGVLQVGHEPEAPSRTRPTLWPLLALGGMLVATAAGGIIGAIVILLSRKRQGS
jgi:hypothetical protein